MKPLSKTQQYALKGMLSEGKTVTEIAQLLNRKADVIEQTIQELKLEDKKVSQIEKAGIVTKTAGKKNSNVAVMTQAGSQRGDESRKKATGQNRYEKSIYRPKK